MAAHPPPRTGADLPPFQSLDDLERLAAGVLPPMVLGYYASGAEDEATLRDNRAAWRRWRLLPRVMVDVSRVDTSARLLGEEGGWDGWGRGCGRGRGRGWAVGALAGVGGVGACLLGASARLDAEGGAEAADGRTAPSHHSWLPPTRAHAAAAHTDCAHGHDAPGPPGVGEGRVGSGWGRRAGAAARVPRWA